MPRGKSKKKQLEEKKLNATVVIMIVLAILLGVLIYMKAGIVGETISPILGGVFGYIKYLIPPGLFLMAVYVAINREIGTFPKKLIMFVVILVLVDGICLLFMKLLFSMLLDIIFTGKILFFSKLIFIF